MNNVIILQMLTLPRGVPQSQQEWLEFAPFEIGDLPLATGSMHYAHLASRETSDRAVVMVGGIPRDPNRQQNLPLINKLYGCIALLAHEVDMNAFMYQQVGTGQSAGDMKSETIATRVNHLVEFAKHLRENMGIDRVSLIGMSLGSYLVTRSAQAITDAEIEVEHLVLQSPAAYPLLAEDVPYGDRFTEILRNEWPIDQSPAFSDLGRYLTRGGRATISFFEKDSPPIPEPIQQQYFRTAEQAMTDGLDVTCYTIAGVEHNFRRIGSEHGGNVVHNGSVRATAQHIVSLIA